jgi:hypothetical protein
VIPKQGKVLAGVKALNQQPAASSVGSEVKMKTEPAKNLSCGMRAVQKESGKQKPCHPEMARFEYVSLATREFQKKLTTKY